MMKDKHISFRIDPPEEIQEIVTHFYVAQNNSDKAITKKLVPTFQTILVFSFGNLTQLVSDENTPIEVGKCVVLGPVKNSFTYRIPSGGQLLVVNFKDDAFYRFFGEAMLGQGRPIHPDQLLTENCFDNLWHQLSELPTSEERVNLIIDFCQPYRRASSNIAQRLTGFQDETQSQVKAVAAEMELSERTIQKEHKNQFGFTAKEKNRYLRFLKTIRYLQNDHQKTDWQAVVHEFDYYDQSQLIHDFQYYLGISPKQYLKFHQDICLGSD